MQKQGLVSAFLLLFCGSSVLATICDQVKYPAVKDEERKVFVDYHNELRKAISDGSAANYVGKLPSAKNMYMLKYDCNMEKELAKELDKCSPQITFTNGYGQNIAKYTNDKFIAIADMKDKIKTAMESWYNPVLHYGIRNRDNIFSDARLYSFANMIYAKTLRIGCAYKECNGKKEFYVSCIYNLIGGFPNNVLYESGTPCKKHADCNTYSSSTCDKAKGLCNYSGKPPRPGGGENTMCVGNNAMTDLARNKVLDAHNSKRSLLARGQIRSGKNPHNQHLPMSCFMPKMIYDCPTETEAIKYASTCSFKKSPESERPGLGENIFIYPIPNADPSPAFEAATESWWSQVSAGVIKSDLKFDRSLRDKAVDQRGFTQMAWAKSVKIGCAIQTCDQSSFVVCRYSPAGNILNEQIYQPGSVCGGCSASCNISNKVFSLANMCDMDFLCV
ncbi:SCP-like protein [Ancylostoma caninum]|uniref:SCP-like protein n=1 Tax=Ancylostoma caninum TaxID=29170 RepID=A0A368GXT3_ANCCA|nr:SCP-like protein [Ancylostoma caninum]